MGKTAVLVVKILGDAKNAQKALTEAATGVDKFQAHLGKMTPAALGIVGGIGLVGKAAYDAANSVEQSMGALDSVFGDNSAAVKKWADDAATAVGLSKSQYAELASVIGAQLNNLTGDSDVALAGTQDLIGIGADLAATFGGTTADAVGALSAALRGEADPAEAYGLSLSQTAVNARLAQKGMDKLEGQALTSAKAQTVLELATEQAGGALGQFSRESDTAAGTTQIAAAQFENAKAALGEQLLPVVAQAMTMFGDFSSFVQDNTAAVTIAAGVIGGLAGTVIALNAAMKIYKSTQAAITTATKIWTKANTLLSKSFLTNPVFLVIAAIIAVIAVLVILFQRNKAFRDFVLKVWKVISDAAVAAWDWIKAAALAVWEWMVGAWQSIVGVVTTVWDAVSGVIAAAFNFIKGIVLAYVSFWVGVWRVIFGVIKAVWNAILAVIRFVIKLVIAYVKIWAIILSAIWDAIGPKVMAVWNAVAAIIGAVVERIKAVVMVIGTFLAQIWAGVVSVATTIWGAIVAAVQAAVGFIVAIVQTILAFLAPIWQGIVDAATAAWQWIVDAVTVYINSIIAVVTLIRDTAVAVWEAIKTAAKAAWDWLYKTVIKKNVDAIIAIVKTITKAAETVWNGIKSAAEAAWEWITGIVEDQVAGIEAIIDGISDAFDAVGDAVESVISWLKKIKMPKVLTDIGNVIGDLFSVTPAPVPGTPTPLPSAGTFAAAPTLSSAAGKNSGGNVSIVVQGALDPVAVARQIRLILRNDERRRNGVVLR